MPRHHPQAARSRLRRQMAGRAEFTASPIRQEHFHDASGAGTEDPKLFNPTDFDARQMGPGIKDPGMKMIIVTATHDGFCLWPSP